MSLDLVASPEPVYSAPLPLRESKPSILSNIYQSDLIVLPNSIFYQKPIKTNKYR